MPYAGERGVKLEILQALMRSLVYYCLRHSHSIQDFIEAAKLLFIEAAEAEMRKITKKINVSRLSVMTGIHRAEVARIYRDEAPARRPPISIIGKVIAQWRHDKRFSTPSGEPRTLTYKGEGAEFKELVASVSKTINPGTVLFGLHKMNCIKKSPKGVKLLRQLYSLQGHPKGGFKLLARDLETLLLAVEQNILERQESSNLHIRTEFDNVYCQDIPLIRRWLVVQGKKFHRRARDFVARRDKDLNPHAGKDSAGAQVVLTSVSLTRLPGSAAETAGRSVMRDRERISRQKSQ